MNLQAELKSVVSGLKWDVLGIIHTDKRISKLLEARVVTAIFQTVIIEMLSRWASKNGLELKDNAKFTRDYPDVTLFLGSERIAIDIKSARVEEIKSQE